jgi:TonB family protein
LKRKDSFKNGNLKQGKCFDENGNEIEYYDFEIQPEFPGGKVALNNYLITHISAMNPNSKGKLVIQFTIETNGDVSNIEILNDTAPSLKKEALHAFSTMPQWKPAQQDGIPVKVKRTIPMNLN